MIAGIILGTWGLVALLMLRPIYGRITARSLESQRKTYYHMRSAESLDTDELVFCALGTLAVSLFWPVVLVAAGLFAWMSGSKYVSPAQRERETEVMRKHIADLERELNIGREVPVIQVEYEQDEEAWWRKYVNHRLIRTESGK